MYIDPGVGSIVIQVIIGSLIAVPFILKTYWKRIKGAFKRENKVDKQIV